MDDPRFQADGEMPCQVFDCFTFSDELEILELRLATLDSVVDWFVLVEASWTFQGNPKELVFHQNRERFARWQHKIIHVPVEESSRGIDAWEREAFQRRAICRGLSRALPSDVALVSDVDEIPNPWVVEPLRREPPRQPLSLDMRISYYCLDLEYPEPWRFPKACLTRDLSDPQALRMTDTFQVVEDAGRHLSWFFLQSVGVAKLESFSHGELNVPRFKTPIHLARCRDLGVDLFGRVLLQPVPSDALPAHLKEFCESRPELLHGPRGPWKSLLARCYLITIRGSNALRTGLRDDHAILAFVVALPVYLLTKTWRRVARVFNPNSRASSIDAGRN